MSEIGMPREPLGDIGLPGTAATGRIARGWHAYCPLPGITVPSLPRWPAEIALSVEMPGERPPAPRWGASWDGWAPLGQAGPRLAGPSVLIALHAPGLALPMVERLRGAAVLGKVPEGRAVALPDPVELPGLAATDAGQVRRHLALAAARGVGDRTPGSTRVAGIWLGAGGEAAAGLHLGGRAARHSRPRGGEARWDVAGGAEVGVTSPSGRSVQAVVTLHGDGEPGLLTPPPGGALLLRAWRTGTDWQVLCAVVVAAGPGTPVGRAAGRLARGAITRSWDAEVLTGHEAHVAARAGDPRHRAPARIARPLPTATFRAVLGHCLRLATAGLAAPPHARALQRAPATLTGLPRVLKELAARPLPTPPPEHRGE